MCTTHKHVRDAERVLVHVMSCSNHVTSLGVVRYSRSVRGDVDGCDVHVVRRRTGDLLLEPLVDASHQLVDHRTADRIVAGEYRDAAPT